MCIFHEKETLFQRGWPSRAGNPCLFWVPTRWMPYSCCSTHVEDVAKDRVWKKSFPKFCWHFKVEGTFGCIVAVGVLGESEDSLQSYKLPSSSVHTSPFMYKLLWDKIGRYWAVVCRLCKFLVSEWGHFHVKSRENRAFLALCSD